MCQWTVNSPLEKKKLQAHAHGSAVSQRGGGIDDSMSSTVDSTQETHRPSLDPGGQRQQHHPSHTAHTYRQPQFREDIVFFDSLSSLIVLITISPFSSVLACPCSIPSRISKHDIPFVPIARACHALIFKLFNPTTSHHVRLPLSSFPLTDMITSDEGY